MIQPKVAVTYNQKDAGSVLSLRSVLADLETEVVDCDYRKLVPETDDLEQIYANQEKMLAVFQKAKQKAKDFLKDIDWLVISGNPAMVDPKLFGQQSSGEIIDLARAIAELALIHIALQKGMPVLAICGGNQILNVYLGGKLGDLSEEDLKEHAYLSYNKMTIDPKSHFAQIINPKSKLNDDKEFIEEFFCFHFQLVEEMGGKEILENKHDYLKTVGRSIDSKKHIEVVESEFGAPVIGLQFHPEIGIKGVAIPARISDKVINAESFKTDSTEALLKSKRIFEAFKQAAQSFKNKRLMTSQIKMGPPAGDNGKTYVFKKANKCVNGSGSVSANKDNSLKQQNKSALNSQKLATDASIQATTQADKTAIRETISKNSVQKRIRFLQNKNKQKLENAAVNRVSLQGIFSKILTDVRPAPDIEKPNPSAKYRAGNR